MTKTTHRRSEDKNTCHSKSLKSILQVNTAIDPSLSLLFASSVQPIKPSVNSYETTSQEEKSQPDTDIKHKTSSKIEVRKEIIGHNLERNDKGNENSSTVKDTTFESEKCKYDQENEINKCNRERKRKRKDINHVENEHIRKLAKQDEEEKRQQRRESKVDFQELDNTPSNPGVLNSNNGDEEEHQDIEATHVNAYSHESLNVSSQAAELEKALRTVFLANVSILAISSKSAKKILLAHMSSFLSDLPVTPNETSSHKIESIRFRSTAYEGSGLPKKVAFAKKKLMSATTKSTNAYIVYSNAYTAREAVKRLNGTVVLDRHLRVDSVAHPSKTDHRRCVFVGNLGFVDEESSLEEKNEGQHKKIKISADVEEGLWRQFSKAGKVESVRVVRDGKTRVGKGFAYVQFTDPNSVEAALLFTEKKYPPLLPRKLRVVRAKALRKTAVALEASHAKKNQKNSLKLHNSNDKSSPKQLSLDGRAKKLLGQSGAAFIKTEKNLTNSGARNYRQDLHRKSTQNHINTNMHHKLPENYVFEGHRASKFDGLKNRKPKNNGRIYSGQPKTRSARRASEWKKTSGTKLSKL